MLSQNILLGRSPLLKETKNAQPKLSTKKKREILYYLFVENSGVSCSNFSHPIVGSFSDRGGRSYNVSHVDLGCQDTLASTALGGVLYTYT